MIFIQNSLQFCYFPSQKIYSLLRIEARTWTEAWYCFLTFKWNHSFVNHLSYDVWGKIIWCHYNINPSPKGVELGKVLKLGNDWRSFWWSQWLIYGRGGEPPLTHRSRVKASCRKIEYQSIRSTCTLLFLYSLISFRCVKEK